MSGILLLGLLIGMQHAMEADHVAAVSSIATGSRSVRRIATHGAVWGFGHTLTLVAVTGAVILLGTTLNETLTLGLELAVGIMLILLGGHVLYRLWRERIHFHSHRHGDGNVHFHAHSHRDEPVRHDPANHDHPHARRLPWRTLLVGMTHGMAGSAALAGPIRAANNRATGGRAVDHLDMASPLSRPQAGGRISGLPDSNQTRVLWFDFMGWDKKPA